MLSGIRDLLIISSPEDIVGYKRLLGDGSQYGLNIEYVVQHKPEGLAQAFILGEEFVGEDNVALVLGDNFFYGQHFSDKLRVATEREKGGNYLCLLCNRSRKIRCS